MTKWPWLAFLLVAVMGSGGCADELEYPYMSSVAPNGAMAIAYSQSGGGATRGFYYSVYLYEDKQKAVADWRGVRVWSSYELEPRTLKWEPESHRLVIELLGGDMRYLREQSELNKQENFGWRVEVRKFQLP